MIGNICDDLTFFQAYGQMDRSRTGLEEAYPDPAMLELPGMRDEMRRPTMLLVKGRKK